MRLWQTLLLTAAVAATTAYLVRPEGGATAAEETAYERVLRTGTIRCGYYTWPGIIEKDVTTGEMKGFLSVFVPALADTVNLKVEWAEEVAFDQILQGLKTKRYDAVCSPMVELPTRARAGLFTTPLFYWPTYAYVRADSRLQTLAQLNHPQVRFASIEGEFSDQFARQAYPQAQHAALSGLQGFAQLYADVATSKADVLLNEPFTFNQYNRNNPGKIRPLGQEPAFMAPVALVVASHEWQLQQWLNAMIRSVQHQGGVERIVAAYPDLADVVIPVAKPYETLAKSPGIR